MRPQFDSISVISDLHLSPCRELSNFSEASGERLVDWTRERIAVSSKSSALVLGGDIVDFLLVENRPPNLDLSGEGKFVKEVLEQLSEEFKWVSRWQAALAAYGQAGGSIVLLPGNHDPEWLLPNAEAAFGEWLGQDSERPWLTVCRDDSWPAQVGSWRITVLHGHRHDPINDIDHQGVLSALSQQRDSFPLPLGSQLVLGPFNEFKKEVDQATGNPRFPFLDAFKPEIPGVGLLLLALDPVLFVSRLSPTLSGFTQHFLRQTERLLRRGNLTLRGQSTATVSLDPAELLAMELAADFVKSLTDAGPNSAPMLLQSIDEYLHLPPKAQSTSQTLGSINIVGKRFLRSWLQKKKMKQQTANFFDTTKTDHFDDRIVRAHLPDSVSQRVVVAGHTHAARQVPLTNDRIYLNTGTWTDLLDVSSIGNSDQDVLRFMTDLENGVIPKFTKLTWADISLSGAVLREVI